jgi:hypothetical protein
MQLLDRFATQPSGGTNDCNFSRGGSAECHAYETQGKQQGKLHDDYHLAVVLVLFGQFGCEREQYAIVSTSCHAEITMV